MLGILASDIRTDRMLDDGHTTGGDVRRIGDLFGLTVPVTRRYATVLDPLGLLQRTVIV